MTLKFCFDTLSSRNKSKLTESDVYITLYQSNITKELVGRTKLMPFSGQIEINDQLSIPSVIIDSFKVTLSIRNRISYEFCSFSEDITGYSLILDTPFDLFFNEEYILKCRIILDYSSSKIPQPSSTTYQCPEIMNVYLETTCPARLSIISLANQDRFVDVSSRYYNSIEHSRFLQIENSNKHLNCFSFRFKKISSLYRSLIICFHLEKPKNCAKLIFTSENGSSKLIDKPSVNSDVLYYPLIIHILDNGEIVEKIDDVTFPAHDINNHLEKICENIEFGKCLLTVRPYVQTNFFVEGNYIYNRIRKGNNNVDILLASVTSSYEAKDFCYFNTHGNSRMYLSYLKNSSCLTSQCIKLDMGIFSKTNNMVIVMACPSKQILLSEAGMNVFTISSENKTEFVSVSLNEFPSESLFIGLYQLVNNKVEFNLVLKPLPYNNIVHAAKKVAEILDEGSEELVWVAE